MIISNNTVQINIEGTPIDIHYNVHNNSFIEWWVEDYPVFIDRILKTRYSSRIEYEIKLELKRIEYAEEQQDSYKTDLAEYATKHRLNND